MKKILTIIGMTLAVVVISAALSFGLLQLVRKENVKETGNILGVSWYDPEGTEFTISTVDELYEFAALSDFYSFENQTVKLDADLVVNEGDAKEWEINGPEKRWNPISNFAGTFDGQGHTISGLYGRGAQTPLAMFIDSKKSCQVQDFSLINSYFKNAGSKGTASISASGDGKFIKIYSNAILNVQGENGGGIVSQVDGQATLEECWYDGTIVQTGRYQGGLIGNITNGRATIKHSLFTGTLINEHDNANRDGNMVGGLVGSNSKTATLMISDSLANGKIETVYNTYVSTMVGVNYSGGTVSMEYVFDSMVAPTQTIMGGSLTAQSMKINDELLIGEKAYQWTTLDFDNYWSAVSESNPVLKHFAENPMDLSNIAKAYDISWYDKNQFEFTLINAQQLYGMYFLSMSESFENMTIKLGADITLNTGKAKDWKASGKAPANPWFAIGNRVVPFNGVFDGQGHTISGLYDDLNQNYNGFIGAADTKSVIKNFRLTNSYIKALDSNELYGIGGVVGESRGLIDSVYTDVIIDTNAYQVGGFAGRIVYMDTTYTKKIGMTNCWFDGEVNLTEDGRYAGGLAGYIGNGSSIDATKSSIDFEHCLSTGLITCTRTTSASVFDPSVSKGGQSIGGLLGQNNGGLIVNISDSLYAGKLDLLYGTYAGAIVGRMNSKGIYNIKNTYCASNTYFLKGKVNTKLYEIHADAIANGGAVLLPDAFIKGYNSFTYTELDFDKYWAVVTDGTPILKQFASKVPSLAGREKMVDTKWYKDDAKEFTIKTVKELYGFWLLSASKNFAGQTIKLGNDIAVNPNDASSVQKWIDGTEKPQNEWLAISSPTNAFAGTFDGQGYTISGLYLALDQERNGFFSATAPGSMIKNFKLVNGLVYNMNSQESFGIGTVAGEIRGCAENIYSNMTIYSNGYQLGGIAGRVVYMDKTHETKLNIDNVWFDGKIIMKDDGRHAGGFAGYVSTGSGIDIQKGTINISNCLSTGYLQNQRTTSASVFDKEVSKGGQDIGGFFGTTNGGVVVNVKDTLNASEVDIIYGTYAGSFIGRFKNKGVFNLNNVYSTTDVLYIKGKTNGRTHYEMQDTAVVNGAITILPDVMLHGANGYKFTSLDFNKYWAAIEDEAPVLKSFATGQLADISQAKKMLDTSWYNKNDKILTIDSVEDMYGFWQLSASENFKGQIIRLGADIDLNEGWTPDVDEATGVLNNKPSNPFLPIASVSNAFAGTFDGQGHTIRGLYMNVMQDYTGLFGATAVGSILKDFRLVDSYYDASNSYEGMGMGLIVGETRGKIDSVYTNATILAIGKQVGGIAGRVLYADGTFKEKLELNNCWFDGGIYLKDDGRWAGGIAGYVSYSSPVKKVDVEKYSIDFENCLNSGYLQSTRKTSASTLDPNESFGGQYIGGLIAGTDGALVMNIDECLVYGDIVVKYNTYVGAVLSRINHSGTYNITNTYATHESYNQDRLYNDITETGVLNKTNFKLVNAADIVNYYAHYSLDLDLKNDWMAQKTGSPVLRSLADASLEAVGNADWYKKHESPYVISIPEELDGLRVLVNNGTSFKDEIVTLGADIVMKSDMEFKPIGISNAAGFDGTFDGKGHSISGIKIALQDTRNVGLFGYTCTNSTIKNFTLKNSTISNTGSGASNTGIIVGVGKGNISGVKVESDVTLTTDSNPSSGFVGIFDNKGNERTISNCWFAGTIISSTTRSGAFAGRVYQGTLNIENCLNTGSITGSGKVGGFLGSGYGSEVTAIVNIKNSLDMGLVSGGSAVGAIVGSGAKTNVTLENVYTTSTVNTYGQVTSENSNPVEYHGIATVLTATDLTGNKAYLHTKLDLKNEWQVSTNGTPVLRSFAKESAMNSFTGMPVHKDWYNNGALNHGSEMKVTEAAIATTADYRGFADIVNVEKKTLNGTTIKLANSLKFNKLNEPVAKIGNSGSVCFDGTFDGQGYTLSGIYLHDTSNHTALFGYTGSNSKIGNFAVKDSSFAGKYNIAVVAGVSKGNIYDVYVAPDVTVNCDKDVNAGGIVGIYDNGGQSRTIENCWFAGSIKNNSDRVAGIAGRCYNGTLTIKNCLVTGTIISESAGSNARAGGVVGNVDNASTLNLTNVIMSGVVKAKTTTTVGSVIGRTNSSPKVNITNVFTTDNRTDLNGNKVSFDTSNAANGIGSSSTNGATIKGTIQIVKADDLKGLNGVTLTKFDFCSKDYLDAPWVATVNGPELYKFHTSEAILDIPGQENLATRWYHEGVKTATGTVYTLNTMSDMYGFAKYVNDAKDDFTGDTILLGADIDFNEGWTPSVNATGDVTNLPTDVNVWKPIGDYDNTNGFNGIFDGQGHTIRGLYVNHTKRDAGLFGITNSKAVIKNFVVTDSYIKGGTNYNAVISGTFRGTLMENIKVAESVTLKGAYANGGFAGMMSTNVERKVSNCWFAGRIFGSEQTTGGILGRSYAGTNTIENCLVTGELTSTHSDPRLAAYVGAADGSGTIKVKTSLALAKLTTSYKKHVGDVIGKCTIAKEITNAYVSNTIQYTGTDTNAFDTTNTVGGTTIDKTLFASKEANQIVPKLFEGTTAWKAVAGSYPVLSWTMK